MPMTYWGKTCWGAILVLLSVGQSAAADPDNGERIAQRWCAQCHVVGAGQPRGSDAVPTFVEIGRSENLDDDALAAFLANPTHSRMPDLALTRSEIADIVAYFKRENH